MFYLFLPDVVFVADWVTFVADWVISIRDESFPHYCGFGLFCLLDVTTPTIFAIDRDLFQSMQYFNIVFPVFSF